MENTTVLREVLETTVGGTYDVIVCGGGPAGSAAAIAAGRAGARVLLLEAQNALGGMWTSGFVNPLFDAEHKAGIMRELIDDLKAAGKWGGFWKISFNYEYMRALLDRKCAEAGVTVLLNTRVCRVLRDGDRVTGIVTENRDGRRAWYAGVVIDATGDAETAAKAGAAFQIGDEETGECQAMTLMFLVSGIPESMKDGKMVQAELVEAFTKAGKPERVPFLYPYLIPAPGSGFGVFQLTHMRGYDPLTEEGVSAATAAGRAQVIEVFEAFRKYIPEFAELSLITSAPMLGIRESRRIVGEYTLDLPDMERGAVFEDGITVVHFNIDIHDAKNNGQRCFKTKPYQIPYRCLIPHGIEGMLVAGRAISGSHVAMASYRVTGDCCAMGEAAGYAAAEAVRQNKSVRTVTVDEILRHKNGMDE